MKFCTKRCAAAATLSHPQDGADNLERNHLLLLLFKNHTRINPELPAPRVSSARRLLVSTAVLGSFAAVLSPAQAARPQSPLAAINPAKAHTAAHLAHLRTAQAHLAAVKARESTTFAAQRVAQAVHNAHLAQQTRIAALRGHTARMQMAGVKLLHARKMALLKSAMQQQHIAMAEVKMQRTLSTRANKMALRQQKLVQVQRKAQFKLASLRHQSLVRLAKLQTLHEAVDGNVVMAAYALRGSRYIMGGTSRSGFDCSGFVRYVLSTTDGVSIPRTAAAQYYHGLPVPVGKMEPGDLVFFKNTYKRGISHVGIYAGQGKFIHAANSHKGVRMDVLNSPYYWGHFAGARRVLPSVMRQAAFLR